MKNIDTISVGIDIESITRFKGLDLKKSKHFLNKIFTKRELAYCFSKKVPWSDLAARFCAKEAVFKAVNSLDNAAPALNEIEISNAKNGAPLATLNGYSIKISLSDSRDKAIALALVEKK